MKFVRLPPPRLVHTHVHNNTFESAAVAAPTEKKGRKKGIDPLPPLHPVLFFFSEGAGAQLWNARKTRARAKMHARRGGVVHVCP